MQLNISVILPLLGHVTLFGTLYLSGTPNSLSPLWDQVQLSLVLGDSNPWRGSNKYFGSLTRSIYSTICWLLRKEWLERLLSNSYVFKTDLGSILPQDMTLKDHDFSDWVFWFKWNGFTNKDLWLVASKLNVTWLLFCWENNSSTYDSQRNVHRKITELNVLYLSEKLILNNNINMNA